MISPSLSFGHLQDMQFPWIMHRRFQCSSKTAAQKAMHNRVDRKQRSGQRIIIASECKSLKPEKIRAMHWCSICDFLLAEQPSIIGIRPASLTASAVLRWSSLTFKSEMNREIAFLEIQALECESNDSDCQVALSAGRPWKMSLKEIHFLPLWFVFNF